MNEPDGDCTVLIDQGVIYLDEFETTVPIDTMYDDEGDETDDPGEAVSCIAEMPNGKWICVDLTDMTEIPLH